MRHSEWVNEVLLSLSNELVKVRDRQNLLKVLGSHLKEVVPFTGCMMTVMDEKEASYTAYLMDSDSRLQELSDEGNALRLPTPADDGIHDIASWYYKPLVFDMETFDRRSMPLWFRLHYETGAREMIVKILGSNGPSQYSLVLFADKPGAFGQEAVNIISRISGQLFTVVSNISANEEILERENEKSFLLDFSSDIAAVRSKADLALAVRTCLKKLHSLNGYAIRKVNEDQSTTTHTSTTKRTYPSTTHWCRNLSTASSLYMTDCKTVYWPVRSPFLQRQRRDRAGNKAPYLQLWKEAGFNTIAGTALRTGNQQLGILWMSIGDINMPLLMGICAQISIAMSNIMANEEILRREKEEAFLHNFSRDIAALRTKDDLERAISNVLHNVLNIRLAIIRVIDEDGVTLSPFMFDETRLGKRLDQFRTLMARTIDINHGLSARVLQSEEPVVFDVEEEVANRTEEPIVLFWQSLGMQCAYGAPLRMGATTIGLLWLLTDEVNLPVFKSICAQISIAISNIQANEKILAYKQKLENENDYLREQIKTIYNFSEIVGSGAQMQKVYRLMTQVAESNSTVLLLGETGTGKELIARAIHNSSPRKSKLMVKVNCAALPTHLIESELFGHEKGAFTGAIDRRIGKFELANNSTLFLDEIGEMPSNYR